MDLDNLAAGDPAGNLANWIVEHEHVDLAAASGELLEAYRAAGGTLPERAHLHAHVAAELVNRAGSAVRRLEKGAVGIASFALRAAQQVR